MTLVRLVQESSVGDACPLCGVTLAQPHRITRRQIVLTLRPGVFCWRCPDCKGTWAVRGVRHGPAEDVQPGRVRDPGVVIPD